jgi:hypothetical protein
MTTHHNKPAWINDPGDIVWMAIQNSILSDKTKPGSQRPCLVLDPTKRKN